MQVFKHALRVLSFASMIGVVSVSTDIYVALATAPQLLGDIDLDGMVTFSDIPPFIAILTAGGFQAEADVDQNGVVDFLDIGPFINILVGS